MVERDDTVATNDNADLTGKNFTCPILSRSDSTQTKITVTSNITKELTRTNTKFNWNEEQIGYVT